MKKVQSKVALKDSATICPPIWINYFQSLIIMYQNTKLTSADARNIFARACFIELDRDFVSPKSSRIGRWGGSLLTRKLPRKNRLNGSIRGKKKH